jgi:hypothetical protein
VSPSATASPARPQPTVVRTFFGTDATYPGDR